MVVLLWGTAADFDGSRILLCAAVVNSDIRLSWFTSVDDFVTELSCFIDVGYISVYTQHEMYIVCKARARSASVLHCM